MENSIPLTLIQELPNIYEYLILLIQTLFNGTWVSSLHFLIHKDLKLLEKF